MHCDPKFGPRREGVNYTDARKKGSTMPFRHASFQEQILERRSVTKISEEGSTQTYAMVIAGY